MGGCCNRSSESTDRLQASAGEISIRTYLYLHVRLVFLVSAIACGMWVGGRAGRDARRKIVGFGNQQVQSEFLFVWLGSVQPIT